MHLKAGWVIGFCNMFNGTSLGRDRTFFDGVNTITVNTDLNWFDILTGRIGYAFASYWLLYGQGVAWTKASASNCRLSVTDRCPFVGPIKGRALYSKVDRAGRDLCRPGCHRD